MGEPSPTLSRTVRFCLNEPASSHAPMPPRHNTFAAWPPMRGLGRYYECHVTCRGEVDPLTGYVINIKHIDRAFRERALPWLSTLPPTDPPLGGVMRGLLEQLARGLSVAIVQVELRLTPYYVLTIRSHDMDRVTIRHQYEFAAAHRLHARGLSEAENEKIFGKCNHAAGHGHNYRVEVALSCPIDEHGRLPTVEAVDELIDTHAIAVMDHKNLNVDLPHFQACTTSVENITRVIRDLLQEPVRRLAPGVELEEVSVWETSKTVCTIRAADAAHV